MNNLNDKSLEGLFACMEILTLHPVWQKEENDYIVYEYVKQHCEEHEGNIVFDFIKD